MSAPEALHAKGGELRSPRRLLDRRRLRLPRYTIRLRLAVLYGGVFMISGTLLLALVFLTVRYSTHGTVVSAQGAAEKLVEGHGVQVGPPGAKLSPTPESLASNAQAHRLGAVAVNVNNSDLHYLLLFSLVALAIMVVASMALGWGIAGRVLRPLQTITAAARDLSASTLHERLALDGPNDELRELGDTFDQLLGRLESSFEAQRQFVANASHELRTPLTLERAILEVTLADPDASAATLRAACVRVLDIGEQQERMIEALLTLARSERGLERRQALSLKTVTSEVLADRSEEITRSGLRLDTKLDPAPTTGDSRLIERLVANLLDNALRHNVADGHIEVLTETRGASAVLSITNTGPVVPAAAIEQLMQPFRRLGAQRITTAEGHGLGLSIVQAIADAHGASLVALAQPDGGLRVEVRFPLRALAHD